MTSVTLKMRSRSPSSNLVFVLPWCSCVPCLVRILQIFLQILSGNHLSYVVALNDLCDLENEVKVTQFELGLCLALVLLCTKFGEDTSNISSDIERKLSFTCCCPEWPLWPWNWGQGHQVWTWSLPYPGCSVYKISWRHVKYFLRYSAETISNMPARPYNTIT